MKLSGMQDYFYSLSDALFSKLQSDEQLLLGFAGEDSDFVRLNHNRIRQAGSVAQRSLSLDLSGRTRCFTHIRFIRSFSNPVQEPLDQPGFLKLFQRD